MPSTAIEAVDNAAQVLLQMLLIHGEALNQLFEPDDQAILLRTRDAATALRRALLGIQMSTLYWSTASDDPESVSGTA